MHTLEFLRHLIALHADLAYGLITLGVIIEGEVAAIVAGVLASIGSINLTLAFLTVLIGGAIKPILGYSIGYYLKIHHSHRPILKKAEARVNYFFPNFSHKPFWSIFASRFLLLGAYWFGVIFAGYRQVKIKTFALAETCSLLAWSVLSISIGYIFSYTALSISHDIRKFLLVLIGFFMVFFIFQKVVSVFIELFAGDNEGQPTK